VSPFERAVRDILDRVSLVQVVSEYVQLKKAGRTYKGLCPFHQEKTPSFGVNEEKKVFYCFGCQFGGNAVTFLQRVAGLSKIEAIRRLSVMSGIPLPDDRGPDPAEDAAAKERADLVKALQVASEFFSDRLASPGGTAAREYLESRGIGREVATAFGLGFGGLRHGELTAALEHRKVPLRHAEAAGLVSRSHHGGEWYERFRGRLVCPVFNLDGAPIAFSARLIPPDEDGPKYVNSPESPVFRKGEALFGLHQARRAIRQQKSAVMVEGNFDVLSLAAVGIGNVVAPMGTALTGTQVKLLKRFTDTVTVMFDGDEAGRKASRRAVGLLVEAGVEGRVAALPDGEDPDSRARSLGEPGVREVLDRAKPMFTHLIDSLVKIHGWTPHGRRTIVEEAREVLAHESDPTRHGIYRQELAQRLQVDLSELRRLLREPAALTEAGRDVEPCPKAERQLLELMVLHPRFIPRFLDEGEASLLTHPEVRDLYAELYELYSADPDGDPVEAFVERGEGGGPVRLLVSRVLATPQMYREPDADFAAVLATLRAAALEREKPADVGDDFDQGLQALAATTALKRRQLDARAAKPRT